MEAFMQYEPYIGWYLGIATGVWLINAVSAGYNGIEPTRNEFFASLIWPVSIATLVGTIIRVSVELLKERKAQLPKTTKSDKK